MALTALGDIWFPAGHCFPSMMKSAVRSLLFASLIGACPNLSLGADVDLPEISIAPFLGDREAALSFTFDDGWEDAASLGAPLLERYGLRGTFFIVPGVLSEEPDPTTKNNYAKVPWKRWREIAAAGHEIGNHSYDHAMHFTDSDSENLRFEVDSAHDLIRDRIGVAPLSFALPSSNTLNDWTVRVIEASHPFTRRQIVNYGGKNCTVESANALVNKGIREKKHMVTLFHAVEQGYDAFSSKDILEGHLRYVAGLREHLWVDTFGRVSSYIRERQEAKIEASAAENGVKFTIGSSWLPPSAPMPLTVVIKVPGVEIAQANREGEEDSLPLVVKADRVLVCVIPGPSPVTVRWRMRSRH